MSLAKKPPQLLHGRSASRNRNTDPSGWEDMTEQSHRDTCDINTIMDRYKQTGMVTHFAKHGASYGDFAAMDFHQAMNTVVAIKNMFEDLPAAARDFFDHDPQAYLDYLKDFDPDDAETVAEMAELGLTPPGKSIGLQMTEKGGEIPPPDSQPAAPVEAAPIDPT